MKRPHFVGWDKIEDGYYTKTKLGKDFDLKPREEDDYDATLKANTPQGWKNFLLYHIENTVEIKRRVIADVDPTDVNIAEGIYILNKSAKRSRDMKIENYSRRKHNIVASSKTRQNKLYGLKSAVIEKLLSEGKMNIIGYHEQKSARYGDMNYLLLGEFQGYEFHIPANKHIAVTHEYLGEIGKISAEQTRKVNLSFSEARKMLEKYIAVEEVTSVS